MDDDVRVQNFTDDSENFVRFFVEFNFRHTLDLDDMEYGEGNEIFIALAPRPKEWEKEMIHDTDNPVIIEVKDK